MKTLESSDINPMVPSTMNNAAVRLAVPVSTAVIWGANVFAGGNSAIRGTSAIIWTNRTQVCNAIWGTCGLGAPLEPVWKPAVARDNSKSTERIV